MGLFDRFFKKNPYDEEDVFEKEETFESLYEQMCEAHEKWTALVQGKKSFDEQYEAATKYIDLAEDAIGRYKWRLEKRILSESTFDRIMYIHPRLGLFFKPMDNGKGILDDYIQDERKRLQSDVRDNEKLEEFRQLPSQLEEIPVIRDDGAISRRRSIEDMPEIKTTPIGKKFDKIGKLATYVIVDVETTGLSADRDRIIQLSAVKVIEGKIMSFYNTYIDPGRSIPADATKINGITDNMVMNAPRIEEVADNFIKYVGKNPVVGYNVSFDLKFLFTSGIDLITNRKIYDAYQLCKTVYKGEYCPVVSYSLEGICRYTGIVYPAHDALYDCIATGMVFEKAIYEKLNG